MRVRPKRQLTSEPSPRAKIVVADDHELARTGVATVIARQRSYIIGGLAADERQTLAMIAEQRPQLLLLDLHLGQRDGIQLIKNLAQRFPATRVLVLADHDESISALRILHAGAAGYLPKSASAHELMAAIETVLKGGIYLSPEQRLLAQHEAVERDGNDGDGVSALTDRELHVFQLIGVGLGTSRIARELGLSPKTVEYYRERIKQKLGLGDASALAAGAREWIEAARNRRPRQGNKTGENPR